MGSAAYPSNEADRLAVLRSYDILDSVCETAFDNIVELASMLMGTPVALLSLVDADRQWFKARRGFAPTQTPREESFCAHAILEPGKPLVVQDASSDPRFADNPLVTGDPGIRFYAGVPLVSPEGMALGTLCVIDRQPRALSESEQTILRRLAETVMTTMELRRAMTQVHRCAMLDFLTGLPNRPALLEALRRALERHQREAAPFGLLYIDLDGFKTINDQLGHAAGDAVLRTAAAALQEAARGESFAARLAGDEFALLVAGEADAAHAAAERFCDALRARMRAQDWPVTASIGAAFFPTAPASVEEALAMADALMYRAKAAGRDCVVGSP